jgi:hypothetical protein
LQQGRTDIIGCGSAIQASLIAFALHDDFIDIIGCGSAIQARLIAFALHDDFLTSSAAAQQFKQD